ncbi:GntR family transcriptional regulator [Corynebacterium uropygiale]|uniref:GntR family transcriptional regulator n=1 Tax=Corynebacterium uropygiale TaxID=1775911 RepID=A0A9X1U069_9CORY|nr:GntR family transcriptional regulator [Corynebacterium uropygiale]MCF4007716.1 GntR family transcriptional regulator [Corynebacterium uropygiale]
MASTRPTAPEQQYLLIASALRESIRSGELSPGESLPSEAALCDSYMSSRGTVRHALDVLRTEGLISSGQGRRSRVLSTVPAQNFDDIISFTQWCKASGLQPGQRTQSTDVRPADAGLAALLDIAEGDEVLIIHRLRLIDGTPAMVERLRYPIAVGRHLDGVDTDAGSIYQAFLDAGVDFHHAQRTIDAVGADEEDARLLGVETSTPLLRVRRRSFDSQGRPVEASDDRYLPQHATFMVTNVRGTPSNGAIAPRARL